MGYPPLPHELNQRHKTEDFEYLKITHKLYTLGVVMEYDEQEGMVDSYGRYWFRVWRYKQNSAQYRVWLAKALREQTNDDDLDAKQYKA